MPRLRPKSTINDLLIFFLIGYVFSWIAFNHNMHYIVHLMFAAMFLILSLIKLYRDKHSNISTVPAYIIIGISLLAVLLLGCLSVIAKQ